MSEDIVKRLRVPPDLMTDFGRVGLFGEAAVEIERLRARVEVLETALRYYADDAYNGHNANGYCARTALEAKP
jgi:hypothetical protein